MNQFLHLAIAQAEKSEMGYKHGAVLIRGHRVVGIGYNRDDRVFMDGNIHVPSTHAEMDASRRVLRGYSKVVQTQ